MQIINSIFEDYHIHSSNFSDWFSSIDEIAKFAWDIWLKKIAITDHSQVAIDKTNFSKKSIRSITRRWTNVWNDLEVIFWIEWDLLNEAWDICDTIQNRKWDFLILSAHKSVFESSPETINKAYKNAIIRHHKDIKLLWHPCMNHWQDYIDIEELISLANEYNLPMEFNCSNLVNGKTNLKNLDVLLKKAKYIYINSDAHTLNELRDNRAKGIEFLKTNYQIKL